MARKSLKDLKNAFQTNSESSNQSRPNNYYPFYRMEFDEKAIVRFLPDLDEENPLGFLIEKLTHTLTLNGEKKNVPCLKMYDGESDCPICKVSAEFYKDEGQDTVDGKRLYRRKQHLAQVLVVEDPLPYKEGEESAQGKVKLINISYSVYNKIKEAFDEDELEEIPWDYEAGTDFMIKKTKKGNYANYDASRFQKRERSITEEEMAAIEGNLIELGTLLPKKPSAEELQKLLDADLNGEVVDEKDADAANARPAPVPESTSPQSQRDSSKGLPGKDDDDDDDDEFDQDADDILASIRQRRQA